MPVGLKKERFNKARAVATLADFLLSITTELFAFLKKFHPFPSGDRPALISCDLTVHKILREREREGENSTSRKGWAPDIKSFCSSRNDKLH